jgi:hypothetical protein
MPLQSQSVGTGYTNSAITKEKIQTLQRKNPNLGSFLSSTFGVAVNTANSGAKVVNTAGTEIDRYTKNVIQTLFSAENYIGQSIGGTTSGIAGGIAGVNQGLATSVAGLKKNLNETLKPVSSFTGSTLGGLTNVLRNPTGALEAVGSSMMNVIDRVSPGLSNKLDSSLKKLKVEELANLPGQVMGSLRNLAALADKILSVPFQIASDLYNGAMKIMQEVSDLIDSAISMVFDLFFGPGGILDSIIPIAAIMEFLEAVGEVAGMIGELGNVFGGFSMITDFASQIGNMSSQFSSMISNPTQLLQAYMPPQVGQYMGMIRNPQQLISNMMPASIKGQLDKISSIPGLGFVGNMSYGIGPALDTLKQGVVSQALSQFSSQAAILKPLLNLKASDPVVPSTQNPFPPSVQGSSINPSIPVVQNVPVQVTPKPKILPDKAEAGA